MSHRYIPEHFHCCHNHYLMPRTYHRTSGITIFNYNVGGGINTASTCGFRGFWGGFGAGLGMGLMSMCMNMFSGIFSGLFGGMFGGFGNMFGGMGNLGMFGGNGLNGIFGNKSGASSSAGTNGAKGKTGAKETKDTDKNVKPETKANGAADGAGDGKTHVKTSAEILTDVEAKLNNGIDTLDEDALRGLLLQLQNGIDKNELSPAEQAKYDEMLKQINDQLDALDKENSADDETVNGDEVAGVADLTPEQVAALKPEQVAALKPEHIGAISVDALSELIKANPEAIDTLLSKLGVEKKTDPKNTITLPAELNVNTIKALAVVSKAAKMPVAMEYNGSSSVVDHYIAGYIDPESVKNDDKLTWTIDCEGVPGALFGNKYTVEHKDGSTYNIKVSDLRKGNVNQKYNETGIDCESKNKQLERNGEPYIKSK